LFQISIGLAAVSFVLAIIAVWQTLSLRRRFAASLGTADGQSLEQTLADHLARVNTVDTKLEGLTGEYHRLADMTGLASQKISVVRFNPFGDTGGDQSFALAVLDSHNSGYILTSIHGREGTRVYVKPIDYGKSKYTLSAEEQQALAQAAKRVPTR
jgi:hypothetical protein